MSRAGLLLSPLLLATDCGRVPELRPVVIAQWAVADNWPENSCTAAPNSIERRHPFMEVDLTLTRPTCRCWPIPPG
ncbi:MAG TPA: hypothetical protein VK458_33715 [Myxococcaceae bacterium]|nr:hypothetical protein [Myxococcaceae bacterium]